MYTTAHETDLKHGLLPRSCSFGTLGIEEVEVVALGTRGGLGVNLMSDSPLNSWLLHADW